MVTLVMVILTADTIKGLYPREDQATLFYHAIGLNELALTPSGRQARRPAPLPTAVDWRYDPALPKQPPGLIPLLDQRMLTTPKVVAP